MLTHNQPISNQHHLTAQKPHHSTIMNQNHQKILPVHQQQPQTPNVPGNFGCLNVTIEFIIITIIIIICIFKSRFFKPAATEY